MFGGKHLKVNSNLNDEERKPSARSNTMSHKLSSPDRLKEN